MSNTNNVVYALKVTVLQLVSLVHFLIIVLSHLE